MRNGGREPNRCAPDCDHSVAHTDPQRDRDCEPDSKWPTAVEDG